ncbi:ferritin-like catalase Nec2 [Cryptomeria japonica]|uniref:ferritin-like catalase Nec2 n=1 Tax=Cryptomeria japonica TaxID=3369 RepID=UPI0027DA3A5A|nr:ferritin-like catalase Nec2 [Cryptomeria japonica]
MAQLGYNIGFLALLFFACLCKGTEVDYMQNGSYVPGKVQAGDVDLVEFPLNLEYLEAEFFLFGALGYGLDKVAPELPSGGPSPVGGMKANLSSVVHDIILEFAYQEVGHLRGIKATVKGFPRPLLNLSADVFANAVDAAFVTKLNPPFDPYANSLNYLLASYLIPYVGLTGYVGINPDLQSATAKRLVAGLLGVESGQDAVIRALLYERLSEKVKPYPYTVAEFTDKLSMLRNRLGHTVDVDEGLVVPIEEGAEGKVSGNILAGDKYSLAFSRTPAEILRIVYSTGNESMPGGFFPRGGGGKIALSYLK